MSHVWHVGLATRALYAEHHSNNKLTPSQLLLVVADTGRHYQANVSISNARQAEIKLFARSVPSRRHTGHKPHLGSSMSNMIRPCINVRMQLCSECDQMQHT